MPEKESMAALDISIVAAEVVKSMADRPGTWDFEKVFRPYVRLIQLRARADLVSELAGTKAASDARILYLFRLGVELRDEIHSLEEELKIPHR
jgi:hypothetical protein